MRKRPGFGSLLIVGGHEDKEGEKIILRAFVKKVGKSGKVVVAKLESLLKLAPGFGLLPGVIIDQHFSQRGRIGRFIGAVAQNPRMLGIGLDEDCGILVQRGRFQVLGSNAVHVVDGSKVTFSNLTEAEPDTPLCIYGVRLHVLNQSDSFELKSRRPRYHPEPVIREWLGLPPKKKD